MANAHALLMDQRAAMMGGKTLPYLRKVAYLESNGSQWIDTGVVPTLRDTIFCKFNFFDSNFRTGAFGCYTNITQDGVFVRVYNPNSKIEPAFMSISMGQAGMTFVNVVSADNEIELSHGRAVMNGVEVTAGKINRNPSLPLYLFTMNYNGSPQLLSHVRVYSFRLVRDGADVVNYNPVLDLSGRQAMYDDVSGRFLYNQGTGDDFAYGELSQLGGYNRQCVRRSYRRLARPSARFCAHSQEWEVAA